MRVSPASREAVELPALLTVVARFCATDLGADRVCELQPCDSEEALVRDVAASRALEGLLEDGALIPSLGVELAPLARRLAEGHLSQATEDVTGADLVLLADVLEAVEEARSRIRTAARAQPDSEGLAALAQVVVAAPASESAAEFSSGGEALDGLAAEIRRRLDPRGSVRPDATARLQKLSRDSARRRQSLYDAIGRFAGRHQAELAEDTIPMHDGRLVVLLRAGAKGSVPGVVKGRSGTGRSLYFEPLEFVEANNDLEEGLREEEAERRRILAELLDRVAGSREALSGLWTTVARLDRRQAACRFAARVGARFLTPGPGTRLELSEARHPLLDPALAEIRRQALGQPGHDGEVIPLDVLLTENGRGLVVTGPNAGGKTVALKSLGLLAIAAHCGLPVPVGADTALPFLDRLVAVVGDEQDLLAERSTFSGRLQRLREAWEAAGPGALVLIDELGSGTDPSEGAALGIALLEALSARGSWTVATTHLTPIAAAAIDLEGFGCAAMEFDGATGLPTYRLVAGVPGASEAIALGRRLGLDERWLERAEELLGPDRRNLRGMLAEVERLRDRLRRDGDRAREERRTAEAERAETERLRAEIETEKATLDRRWKQEVRDFRAGVKRKLADEIEKARARAKAERSRADAPGEVAVEKQAEKTVAELWREAPVLDVAGTKAAEPVTAEHVGTQVEHQALGWTGRLDRLAGKRAVVVVGGKKVRCAAGDLVVAEPPEVASKAKPPRPSAAESLGHLALRSESEELHLRRMRADDALAELDRYLDRAIRAGLVQVRIVHGHGTGRLREVVRRELAGHPSVASFRPGSAGEGGNGVTVAELVG